MKALKAMDAMDVLDVGSPLLSKSYDSEKRVEYGLMVWV
jgi:hypothetical protein